MFVVMVGNSPIFTTPRYSAALEHLKKTKQTLEGLDMPSRIVYAPSDGGSRYYQEAQRYERNHTGGLQGLLEFIADDDIYNPLQKFMDGIEVFSTRAIMSEDGAITYELLGPGGSTITVRIPLMAGEGEG